MKFVYNFCVAPSVSTPHLYISALPFAPEDSVLCRALKARFHNIAKVEGSHQKWPAAQGLFKGHTSYVTSVGDSPLMAQGLCQAQLTRL